MSRKILFLLIMGVIIILGVLAWLFLSQSTTPLSHLTFGSFGPPAANNSLPSSFNGTISSSSTSVSATNSNEKIFNISPGPVISATFVQTNHPTTTMVRFLMQDTGHVFDFPLDVPNAASHIISDTTIPGGQQAWWAQQGSAVLFQYLDNSQTTKTIFIEFTLSTTTTPLAPTEVQFLPDNILSLAVSPDGSHIVYLLKNQSGGTTGYTALADGRNPRVLFSIPLSQVLISWPAPQELLLQTKSAANTPGIVFEVGAQSGAIVSLLYGDGLTALANKDFSDIVYQMRTNGVNTSYDHLLSSGGDVSLLGAFPEKCEWDSSLSYRLYCATPISPVDASYLDLWHQGITNPPDYIQQFNISAGNTSNAIAIPGSADGGTPASIEQLAVSPDDRYLLYITRGDRSLWGVRLTP